MFPSRTPEKRKEYARRYYDKNKAAIHARNKVWVAANPERRKLYQQRHRVNNRDGKLLAKYGVSAAEYDTLHEGQDGKCAICQQPEARRALSVDHNHDTGQVRELLCSRCNTVLGFLHEDINLATRIISYLQKWQTVGRSKNSSN